MDRICLSLLGTLRITRDGVAVQGFESRKAVALLCYLALHGQPRTRAQLADLFWSDKEAPRGRGNLNRVLHNLAQVVPGCLEITRHVAGCAPSGVLWIDTVAFDALVRQDDHASLTAAAELYRDDLLIDLALPDCPQFELWLTGLREHWRQRYIQLLHRLSQHHLQHGSYSEGINWATRLLQCEPWREEAHRTLMQLLAASGQRSAALAQYDICRRVLVEELGVDPDEATEGLYRRILDGVETANGQVGLEQALAPSVTAPHYLPAPTTTFIGRTQELAQIAALLAAGPCRLLTLLGPGGIGKTRLALRTVDDLATRFADGVAWVTLGPNSTHEFVIGSIAEACSLTFADGIDPAQQLKAYLRRSHLLLVIDNGEYLATSAFWIGELVAEAPRLTMLVTSRERLNIQAEQVLEIGGLSVPTEALDDALRTSSAVQLFEQRARLVQPSFTIPTEEYADVLNMCRVVAGSPLAIELAASWARLLSCREIAQEVTRDLDFLSTTLKDVPDRQRSMRTVFDYSWALLSESEQAVCRKLAVFRGSFDRRAAIEVAGATPALLAALVDKSLVRRISGQRLMLHELLRQYTEAELAAFPSEQLAVSTRCFAYYAALLRQRVAVLSDGDKTMQQQVCAEITVEIENIRACWQWAMQVTQHPPLGTFVDDLVTFYSHQYWAYELVQVLSDVLNLSPDRIFATDVLTDSRTTHLRHAQWERQLGTALYNLGRTEESRHYLHRALGALGQSPPRTTLGWMAGMLAQIGRQLLHRCWPQYFLAQTAGTKQAVLLEAGRAYNCLAELYYLDNQSLRTVYSALRALNLLERHGLSPGLARCYANTCLAANLVPLVGMAKTYSQLARKTAQQIQHPIALAYSAHVTGVSLIGHGHWEQARAALLEACELTQMHGDARLREQVSAVLVTIFIHTGQLEQSLAMYQSLFAAGERRGDVQTQAWGLVGQARVAVVLGQPQTVISLVEQGITLLGNNMSHVEEIVAYGLLALAALRCAAFERAEAMAEHVVKLACSGSPTTYLALGGYMGAAEVYLTLWQMNARHPSAARRLERGAYQVCKALRRYTRVFPIGEPVSRLWHGLYLDLSGKAQQAYRAWQAGIQAAQRLSMPYYEGLLHYHLGRSLPPSDPARHHHLAQAHTIFTKLRAAYDLARTEELLAVST